MVQHDNLKKEIHEEIELKLEEIMKEMYAEREKLKTFKPVKI